MDQQISGVETGIEQASAEFVGRWNRLVSTTNWEKGRIIAEWRQRLEQEGLPPNAWTDEAWSLVVGNVSPQHVGRLRRVYQRFGQVAESYPRLFWSHFQAAIDWDDAEMWLEGAVQNQWSVSQMRKARWEATGGGPDAESMEADVAPTEFDEDSDPPVEDRADAVPDAQGEVRDSAAEAEAAPFDASDTWSGDEEVAPAEVQADDPAEPAARPVRPFENLPPLPSDLADAFEQFKLIVLKHKVAGWNEVPCADVLAALDALKQLVTAP
jgi:hypothetical protein